MKRCSNPNCESEFLFSDNKNTCPFCHSMLITNNAVDSTRQILFADRIDYGVNEFNGETREFLKFHLGSMECHGRIVEIEHHEIFNSKWHKIINAIFRDEPYQLAHQTIEYTIRVESISNDIAVEVTDFCMYGSYLGRLQVGDEVRIYAKDKGNHRIVRKIFNETIGSEVRPGFQIPSVLLKFTFVIVLLTVMFMVLGLFWLVKSGVLISAIKSIITAFLPLIIVSIGICMLIRSILPKNGRRRK